MFGTRGMNGTRGTHGHGKDRRVAEVDTRIGEVRWMMN